MPASDVAKGMCMAELLMPMATGGHRDDIAVDDGRRATTWTTLNDRANSWIDLFRAAGLRPGDRVAVVSGNRVETVEILLACLHSGLVIIPVNWHLTAPEIAYLLTDSGAAAVVADAERAAVTSAALPERPALALVYGERSIGALAAVEPLLRNASPAEPGDQVSGSAGLYTSGTTGAPKCVVTSLFGLGEPVSRLRRRIERICGTLGIPAGGANLLCGPWYHSGQLFFALLPLLTGSRLVTRSKFRPEETLDLIDRARITTTHLVPTQFIRLLRLPEPVRAAFSGRSLRLVWHGAAPCPPDVKRAMLDWWGPVLVEYYAATEAGIATLIHASDWLARPGSVGRAVIGTELLIVDEHDHALPPGRVGRVFLRRNQGFEYRNAPEKTRAAHRADGSFTYGDAGYLDGDGFLYLTGRADDMILSGGVNIYPAEVEAALLSHPAVRDAVVLGVPDAEFGEQVRAVIEVDPAFPVADLTNVLDAHCRTRLAGFKVPRSYELTAALPREESGKVRRRVLRARHGAVSPAGPVVP